MSYHNNMFNVVDDTAKFQSSWFCGDVFVSVVLIMWHKVTGIPDDEHVTDLSLAEPRRQHPAVHTREHYG
jgi:hypothetical protein